MACGESGVEAAGVPTIMECYVVYVLCSFALYLLIPTCMYPAGNPGRKDGWWYIVAYIHIL